MAHKQALKDLVGNSKCPSGFSCYEKPHKVFHKPEKLDGVAIIECIKDAPGSCKFAVPFGSLYFCKCPTGNRIATGMYKKT